MWGPRCACWHTGSGRPGPSWPRREDLWPGPGPCTAVAWVPLSQRPWDRAAISRKPHATSAKSGKCGQEPAPVPRACTRTPEAGGVRGQASGTLQPVAPTGSSAGDDRRPPPPLLSLEGARLRSGLPVTPTPSRAAGESTAGHPGHRRTREGLPGRAGPARGPPRRPPATVCSWAQL